MPTESDERMKVFKMLICECEGVCSDTKGIEKNYLGRFNNGANWRQVFNILTWQVLC